MFQKIISNLSTSIILVKSELCDCVIIFTIILVVKINKMKKSNLKFEDEIRPISTRSIAAGILVALIISSLIGVLILKRQNNSVQVFSGQQKLAVPDSITIKKSSSSGIQIDNLTTMSFTLPQK